MIKHLSNLFKKKPAPQPDLPINTRIYCLGDIHGRDDLLQQLLIKISADSQDFGGQLILVFLGDYIDRGQNSKQVLDTLIASESDKMTCIYLRGNHEQVLLDCLDDPAAISSWLTYGGLSTLVSYGVAVPKIPTKPHDFYTIQQDLKQTLPLSHKNFLLGTQLSYSLGSYFFVHAGIYPKQSLAKQRPEDLLWIRDDFIQSTRYYEKIIVHGHTIHEQPQLLAHRIGIDTVAYYSGILTCLVLESNTQRLLQTTS